MSLLLFTGLCAPASSFSYLESVRSGTKLESVAASGSPRKNFNPAGGSFKTPTPTTGPSYLITLRIGPGSVPTGVANSDTYAASTFSSPPTATLFANADSVSTKFSPSTTTATSAPPAPYMKKSKYMYSPKSAKSAQQTPSPAALNAGSQLTTTPSQPTTAVSSGSYMDNISPPSATKKSSYVYSPKTAAKPTKQSSSYLDNMTSTPAAASSTSYMDNLSPPSEVRETSFMYSPTTSKPLQQSSSYLNTMSSSPATVDAPELVGTAPQAPITTWPGAGASGAATTSASYMDALSPPSKMKKSSYRYSPKKANAPKSGSYLDDIPKATQVEGKAPPKKRSPADKELARLVRRATPIDRLVRRVTLEEKKSRSKRGGGLTAKDVLRLLAESPPYNGKPGWFYVPPDPIL
jgi:hypothetical protein